MTAGLHAIATADPARPAMVFGGEVITFGALETSVNQLAAGLAAAGVTEGSRVALSLHNRPEYLAAWCAAGRLGASVVPIGHSATAPETRYVLQDSGATLLVHDRPDVAADAIRDIDVKAVAVEDPALWTESSGPPNDTWLHAMPSAMSYTSGTTGRPKGIVRQMPPPSGVAAKNPFADLFGYREGGVHLVVAPLYHTAPGAHALMNLWEGATVVLTDRFDPEEALALIGERRVTTSFMTPAHFIRILETDWRRYDRSSVERIWHAGAPCPVAVKQRILEVFPDAVWEFYGMSEGMGGIVSPDEWQKRPGTVGRPFPGIEYRICDDDGTPLPPGEPGLLYVSPMGGSRFSYHNAADKTQEAWRDGFYTVGDIGYLDDDGYLFLLDRRTDLILRNGVNVYSAEVEQAIATHPDVVDAAVIGLPDERTGQRVHAVVELRPGAAADGDALLMHLRGQLAPFKLPAEIELVEVLPREPNGKILKRKLREDRSP